MFTKLYSYDRAIMHTRRHVYLLVCNYNWRGTCINSVIFSHVAFNFIEKHTPPPHFSLPVSLSFSRNNIAKTKFFSWQHPSQTMLLFFQTIESAKRTFAARAGSGKPAFLHALFLKNEKQNSRKNYGAPFSC